MATTPTTQPTLWRTCRVIASHNRLQVFELLTQEQPPTVSAVAGRLDLPLPAASQAMRALESRGLLASRRIGRRVEYRIAASSISDSRTSLVATLRTHFRQDKTAKETIFRLATAFTHPCRIEIFRLLQTEPQVLMQLETATRISARARLRHLRKLEARGFITSKVTGTVR